MTRGPPALAVLVISLVLFQLVALSPTIVARAQSESPDFTLTVPTSASLAQAWTSPVQFNLSSVQEFAGHVMITGQLVTISTCSFVPCFPLQPPLQLGDLGSFSVYSGIQSSYYVGIYIPPVVPPGCCQILELNATSGTISHVANVTVTIDQQFLTLTSTQPSLTVPANGQNSTLITVTGLNSFSGQVGLEETPCAAQICFGLPGAGYSGVSLTIAPSSATVGISGSANFNVTFQANMFASPGTVYFAVSATSANNPGYSDGFSVEIHVTPYTKPDFILAIPKPSSEPFFPRVQLREGGSNSTVVMLTGMNNFEGTVTLSSVGKIPASFTPPSLRIEKNETETVNLSVSAPYHQPAGMFLVNVTGISGALVHSDLLTVAVLPFFAVDDPNSPVKIVAGGASTNVTLPFEENGYGYNFTIQASTPSGVNAIVQPQKVESTRYVYQTVNLSVRLSASGTIQPGDYTVSLNVTPSMTGISLQTHAHQTIYYPSQTFTVKVTVEPAAVAASPAPSRILGLDPPYAYGLLTLVTLAALGAAVGLLRRRRPRPAQ